MFPQEFFTANFLGMTPIRKEKMKKKKQTQQKSENEKLVDKPKKRLPKEKEKYNNPKYWLLEEEE